VNSRVKSGSAPTRAPPPNDPQIATSPASIAALESAAVDPTQFPALRASTGTADDDDAPGDEHARENEAAARETSEDTETPEEFDPPRQ
jgi:hypothetical protein